jgi:hypothetical protein
LEGGRQLCRAQLRAGDRSPNEFLAMVDQHIERTGIEAPAAPGRAPPSPAAIHSPAQLDIRSEPIGSLIWATSHDLDFAWVELLLFDTAGAPIHTRGVTALASLYFLGLAAQAQVDVLGRRRRGRRVHRRRNHRRGQLDTGRRCRGRVLSTIGCVF